MRCILIGLVWMGGAHARDAAAVNAGSQAFVLGLSVGGEAVLSASNLQNAIGRSILEISRQKLEEEARLRTACRLRHYSHRTEDAYWMWARRFIVFHGRRPPREMGGAEAGRAPASAMPAWD